MTYLGFLIGFVLLPILLLLVWMQFDKKAKKLSSLISKNMQLVFSFIILTSLALLYTTPWDNYLVATGVWWYDADKVLGIILGWVPLEEYLFFILQPVLGGLILLLVYARRTDKHGERLIPAARSVGISIALLIWLAALAFLILGIPGATYLGLELIWAVPVIMLQLAFGADILWKYRHLLIGVILGLTIYLSAADAIAIQSGVWTIDPQQSSGLLLGGILPIEEFIFFLLTNIMVGFGFLLIWAPESHARLVEIKNKLSTGRGIADLGKES